MQAFYMMILRTFLSLHIQSIKEYSLDLGMSQKAFVDHIRVIPSYYYKLNLGTADPLGRSI